VLEGLVGDDRAVGGRDHRGADVGLARVGGARIDVGDHPPAGGAEAAGHALGEGHLLAGRRLPAGGEQRLEAGRRRARHQGHRGGGRDGGGRGGGGAAGDAIDAGGGA
jgi:hypothetical protein